MDELSDEVKKYISKLPHQEKLELMADLARINVMSPGEPCWCSSGKTFGACHLNRDKKRIVSRSEEGHVQAKIFNKHQYCSASYDSENCVLPIKGAHTIQRSRVLISIAENGHVGTFYRNYYGGIDEKDVQSGIKSKASIFYGFCSFHDTEIFKAIEVNEFSPSLENCWATSYRAICHEYYQKKAAVEAVEWKINNLDAGRTLIEQLVLQWTLHLTKRDICKGLSDVIEIKEVYESIKLAREFSGIKSLIVEMDMPLSIAVCGSISPYYDLDGMRLQNFAGQQGSLQYITISTVCIDGHAVYCISSLSKHGLACAYIDRLASKDSNFLKDWLFTSIFAHIENNFFSLVWWRSLSKSEQNEIAELALSENYTKPIEYQDFPARVVPGKVLKTIMIE